MSVYVVEVNEATRCWVFGVFDECTLAMAYVDAHFTKLSNLALEIYVCKAQINLPKLDGLEVICGRYSSLDEDDNEIWSDWIWENQDK